MSEKMMMEIDHIPRRTDGRTKEQLRPPMAELGFLNRCDGSARFAQGQTSVLAAIYGPGIPRHSRKERVEGATIEVTLHPHKGQSTSSDKEKEAFIKSILSEVIMLEKYPRTAIHIIVQVFEDDGGLLACAINASCLAALNAGLDMKYVPLSITISILNDDSNRIDSQIQQPTASTLLLDPTATEQSAGKATATLTASSTNWGLVSASTCGPMSPTELFAAIEMAKGAAMALLAFIRLTVEEHTKRTTQDWDNEEEGEGGN